MALVCNPIQRYIQFISMETHENQFKRVLNDIICIRSSLNIYSLFSTTEFYVNSMNSFHNNKQKHAAVRSFVLCVLWFWPSFRFGLNFSSTAQFPFRLVFVSYFRLCGWLRHEHTHSVFNIVILISKFDSINFCGKLIWLFAYIFWFPSFYVAVCDLIIL